VDRLAGTERAGQSQPLADDERIEAFEPESPRAHVLDQARARELVVLEQAAPETRDARSRSALIVLALSASCGNM
jgi:hypothetical protein